MDILCKNDTNLAVNNVADCLKFSPSACRLLRILLIHRIVQRNL